MTEKLNLNIDTTTEELFSLFISYYKKVNLGKSNKGDIMARQQIKTELRKKGIEDISVFSTSDNVYKLRYVQFGSKREIQVPVLE